MASNKLRFALLFFIIFAAFFHLSTAAVIFPKNVGKSTATVNITWTVDLNGQHVQELHVRSFGFKDYVSQRLLSETSSVPFTPETDAFGNRILKFRLDPGKQVQTFSLISKVRVDFPFNYEAANDNQDYLKDSPKAVPNPAMRDLAVSVSAGEQSRLGKALALALWVHNNVAYDFGYIDVSNNAGKVFSDRKGTCDEFSHLLISLLRAEGIPAKFSASFVYSGSEWGAHAFVEVRDGDHWVPIDPTFNEALLLDATHIKFGEGFDQSNITEQVQVTGVSVDAQKIKLTRQASVSFDSSENFPKLFDLDVALPKQPVGEGSLEKIIVKIKNSDKQLAVPLSLAVPKELTVVSEGALASDKLVLLAPGEERTVEWKVQFPEMQKNLLYTFPVRITALGQTFEGEITGTKAGTKRVEENIDVSSISSTQNGSFISLSLVLKNTGNADIKDAQVLLDYSSGRASGTFSLKPGEEKRFSYVIPKPGSQRLEASLRITTEQKDIVQPIVVTLDQPIPQGSQASNSPAQTSTQEGLNPGITSNPLFYPAIGIVLIVFAAVIYFGTKKH